MSEPRNTLAAAFGSSAATLSPEQAYEAFRATQSALAEVVGAYDALMGSIRTLATSPDLPESFKPLLIEALSRAYDRVETAGSDLARSRSLLPTDVH